MIRFICFLILVLGIQFEAKCDTIPNWQVYQNDQLLVELNSFSGKFFIVFTRENLKVGDSITVHYFQDTPCFDCPSILSVEDGKHREIATWIGTGTFSPKTFLLDKLLESGKEYFEVYYHEGEINSRTERSLLFRIRLE